MAQGAESCTSLKLLRLIGVVTVGDTIILSVISFLRSLDTRRDTLNHHIQSALLRSQIGLLRRSPLHALRDDCPCLHLDLFLPLAFSLSRAYRHSVVLIYNTNESGRDAHLFYLDDFGDEG